MLYGFLEPVIYSHATAHVLSIVHLIITQTYRNPMFNQKAVCFIHF